jgi:hypothetical protein
MFLVSHLYRAIGYALVALWRLCAWFTGYRSTARFEPWLQERSLERTQGPTERMDSSAPETATKTLLLESDNCGRGVSSPRLSPLSDSDFSGVPRRAVRGGRATAPTLPKEDLSYAPTEGQSAGQADAQEYGSGSHKLVSLRDRDLASSVASRWPERLPAGLVAECFMDQSGALYVPATAAVRYAPKSTSSRWPEAVHHVSGYTEECQPEMSILEGGHTSGRANPAGEVNGRCGESLDHASETAVPGAPLTASSIREAVLEAMRVSQERAESRTESGHGHGDALPKDPKELRRLMRRVYLIMYSFIFSTALLMFFFFQQDGPMTTEHRILLCVVLPIYVLCFTMLHSFGDNFPANLVMLVLLSSCSWFAIGFLSAFYLHRHEVGPLARVGSGATKLSASVATVHT